MAAFLVVKSVDAYVKYSTVIEAETAQDAIDEAQRYDVEFDWRREHEVEFDDTEYFLEEVEELTPEEAEEEKNRELENSVCLTASEWDAVIAGLRALQDLRTMTAGELPSDIQDILTNGGEHDGLSDAAIDALIEEKINV